MAAADGRCKISIFYSIQRTEEVEYDVGQVERAFLSPQTRAYVFSEDRMRVAVSPTFFTMRTDSSPMK